MGRKRKEVSAAQQKKIEKLYAEGWGLLTISKTLGHNVGVIRRVVVAIGLKIRGRGRPRKTE